MRPRISQQEAQFLLETLQTSKEQIQGLRERKEQLDREVYRLKREARLTPTLILKPEFKDKTQELKCLEAQSYNLFVLLGVYESLISKFQVMASGEKHKGRYKSEATRYQWRLNSLVEKMEPKAT